MNEYIEISELISNLVTNVIEPNIIPAFHILELDDGDKITLTINSNEFGEAQTITLKRYLKSDEKNNFEITFKIDGNNVYPETINDIMNYDKIKNRGIKTYKLPSCFLKKENSITK